MSLQAIKGPSHQDRLVSQDRTATSLEATGPTGPFLLMVRFPISGDEVTLNPCIKLHNPVQHISQQRDFISVPPALGALARSKGRFFCNRQNQHYGPSRNQCALLCSLTHLWESASSPEPGSGKDIYGRGELDVWLKEELVQTQNSSCKCTWARQQPWLQEVRRALQRHQQQRLACPCQGQILGPPFPYCIQGLQPCR